MLVQEYTAGAHRSTKGRSGTGHASAGGDFVREVVKGERDGDVGRFVVKDGIRAL